MKIHSIKLSVLVSLFFLFSTNYLVAQSSLHLISPSGGENFGVGLFYPISWQSKNIENINISYSENKGKDWKIIFKNIPAQMGTLSWKIPNAINEHIWVKIEDTKNNYSDVSDSYFTIIPNHNFNKLNNTLTTSKFKPAVIMPLGNSITFGITNGNLTDGDRKGYRYFLYDSLIASGYQFEFTGSEHSGWHFLPQNYDRNAGFPGIKDHQLAYLLKTGIKSIPPSVEDTVTLGPYLDTYPADIILLHIGTNGNNEPGGTSPTDVEDILNEIDRYEDSTGSHITVILARIINRSPNQNYVTVFNDSVESMALDRVLNPANPHYPDDIRIANMESIPGFDYAIDSAGTIGDGISGDMAAELHPNEKGYLKMADVWLKTIKLVLGNPPVISGQPLSQGVIEGEGVAFSVAVTDTSGMQYQWYKNGIIINGANSPVYSLSTIDLSDNGAKFKCEVYNKAASVFTDEVTLSVTPQNEKVLSGVQTAYNFREGAGQFVDDVSGVGAPLNLQIADTSKIDWIPLGLKIKSGATISSGSPPTKIFNSCTQSNEITIETWLLPSSQFQYGPARIITYSKNKDERNFTMGQDSSSFQTRLRTISTNLNGKPSLNSSDFSTLKLMNVVYTHNKNGESKYYIDGVEVSNSNIGGDFSNWDSSYSFGIGNEFIDARPWEGTIFYSAIFNRALSTSEVQHNFSYGLNGVTKISKPSKIMAQLIVDSNTVDLTWEDNSNLENGFIIEGRPAENDSVFKVIDTVSANTTSYTDTTQKNFLQYQYRVFSFTDYVKSEPSDTVTLFLVSVESSSVKELPTEFNLEQNYPNPFNPTTTIKYSLPVESNVNLTIYNSIGQKIREIVNRSQQPGNYSILFNAANLVSGVYFYSLKAYSMENKLKFNNVKKLILIK